MRHYSKIDVEAYSKGFNAGLESAAREAKRFARISTKHGCPELAVYFNTLANNIRCKKVKI